MPLTYVGAGGIMQKLGRIIRASRLFEEQETTNAAGYLFKEMADIQAAMESVNEYDDEARILLQQIWDEFNLKLQTWKRDILDLVSPVLRQALDEDEDFHTSDLISMVEFLKDCMIRDGQTVLQNTVSIVGPSAGLPAPTGDFRVVVSNRASTAQGYDSLSQVNGALWSNYYRIVCTSNQASGAETFEIRGNMPRNDTAHPLWYTAGLAGMTRLISSDGNTLLSNGGFEYDDASGTSFTNWSVTGGVWGVDLKKNVSGPYRGSQCLEFPSTAVPGRLTQVLGRGTLQPFTKYIISYKVKKTGAPTGGLRVGFTGTAGLYHSQAVAFVGTDYTVKYHIFNTGADPSEITDFIVERANPGGTGSVYVDEVCLSQVDIFNGLGVAVIGGAVDPALDDYWTVEAINNYAGAFMTHFARWYGVLLPGSAVPTIPDALATT
ncbi:MAG TPA: hypothetical protein PLN14_07305 [Candidatus Hydrothermia bacterium]|nr:hypothetical protein [Candidatus Hydrothermia bacterium]